MEEIYRKQRNQQSYLKRKAVLQEREQQEMERQEKIQKIDELRKNVVGFIISKSEAGELVIFLNYYLMIPTNSIHIACY